MADFQSHIEEFKNENVDVVALSADPRDAARETVSKLQLTFPVVCGLEVPRDADKVGAFWDGARKIIQPSNFLLDSDKRLAVASYSTGAIGRIVAADALIYIQFLKKKAKPS